MTDPIADMLARVRNAALAQHANTRIPASKLKHSIAKILKDEGYIADVRSRSLVCLPGHPPRVAPGAPGLRASQPDPARVERAGHVDPEHFTWADDGYRSSSPQGGR